MGGSGHYNLTLLIGEIIKRKSFNDIVKLSSLLDEEFLKDVLLDYQSYQENKKQLYDLGKGIAGIYATKNDILEQKINSKFNN